MTQSNALHFLYNYSVFIIMFTKHIPRFQLVSKTLRKVMNSFVENQHGPCFDTGVVSSS